MTPLPRRTSLVLFCRTLRDPTRSAHLLCYYAITPSSLGSDSHSYCVQEFYQRKQPNFLVPRFVYKARREHYIYWETSRLARGKSTIFTHYEWDKQSVTDTNLPEVKNPYSEGAPRCGKIRWKYQTP